MTNKSLILPLLLMTCVVSAKEITQVIECGSWIEISAHAFEDYRFVRWNDGNTDSVRRVEVLEDHTYIAFFSANCREYANWPVISNYGTILMLNMKYIHDKGYYFREEDVSWYRVVGTVDDLDTDIKDDIFIGHGYSITIDNPLMSGGDYYAIVDVSANASAQLCTDIMRSEIAHFVNYELPSVDPKIIPNYIDVGQQMTLIGLNPNEYTTIRVYTVTGKLLQDWTSHGISETVLDVIQVAGCYYVQVNTEHGTYVLRYIIRH